LRDSDLAIDNVKFTYRMVRSEKYDTPFLGRPIEIKGVKAPNVGPFATKAEYECEIVFRGSEIGGVARFVRADPPFPDWLTPTPMNRWSCRRGIQTIKTTVNKNAASPGTFALDKDELTNSSCEGPLHECEFCCGIGLGRRLMNIVTLEPRGGLLWLKGRMRVWSDADEFEALLDDDLLVRNLKVVWATGKIETKTEGTVDFGGRKFAKTGSFVEVRNGRQEADLVISMQGLRKDLNDPEFLEAVALEPDPNATVIDHRGLRLQTVAQNADRLPQWLLWAFVNLIGISALVYLWLRSRRLQSVDGRK
jgi:hypothetical protein